jgi:hypothetical protein
MCDVKATDIERGYHQDGFRIDKNALAMDRYTRWEVSSDGQWTDAKPVCFHSLPQDGWCPVAEFDWTLEVWSTPSDDGAK